MKFQVPQFVEVEDKIFWKLTLKQFIYVAGGAGLSVMIFLSLPRFVAIMLIAPVVAFALALAFYQHNNRPFIFLLESAVKYLFNSKLYIWKREEQPANIAQVDQTTDSSAVFSPKLSDSKLKELSWSLDAKSTVNRVTQEDATK